MITADLKLFFYINPMKIQALVLLCGKFQYACIEKSIEPVLTIFFVAPHARATQKLLHVCKQVKITWRQVRNIGRMERNGPGKASK
jgi:hypothetical protein